MNCPDCDAPINPEWTECEGCGAPLSPIPPGEATPAPVSGGRKWGGRFLRFLSMFIVGIAILVGLFEMDDGADFPLISLIIGTIGIAINIVGRKVNPAAWTISLWGIFGGVLGFVGALLLIGFILLMAFIGAVIALFS